MTEGKVMTVVDFECCVADVANAARAGGATPYPPYITSREAHEKVLAAYRAAVGANERLAKIVERVKALPRWPNGTIPSMWIHSDQLDAALAEAAVACELCQASPATTTRTALTVLHGYGKCVERRGNPKYATRPIRTTMWSGNNESPLGHWPRGRRTGRDRRKRV